MLAAGHLRASCKPSDRYTIRVCCSWHVTCLTSLFIIRRLNALLPQGLWMRAETNRLHACWHKEALRSHEASTTWLITQDYSIRWYPMIHALMSCDTIGQS